jgi:hypothetical protein
VGRDLDPLEQIVGAGSFDDYLIARGKRKCSGHRCDRAATHAVIDEEVYPGREYCFLCACDVRDAEAERSGRLSEKGRRLRSMLDRWREEDMLRAAWERYEDAE